MNSYLSLNFQACLHIGHCWVRTCEFSHLTMQCMWKQCVQDPQTSGQSSPGSVHSVQQLSKGIRQIPQFSSLAIQRQVATPVQSVCTEVNCGGWVVDEMHRWCDIWLVSCCFWEGNIAYVPTGELIDRTRYEIVPKHDIRGSVHFVLCRIELNSRHSRCSKRIAVFYKINKLAILCQFCVQTVTTTTTTVYE